MNEPDQAITSADVDNMLAIKRIVVVALPASMSATITDALK